MWIKISIKTRIVFVLFFSGKIFSMGRRNYCHKELIIYWKRLSRSKGNRSFTFLSSTRSAEQKLSIHANWKFFKREVKILHLNVGSNKPSLYQDWMLPLVLQDGAIKSLILQFKIFAILLIVEKVKFFWVFCAARSLYIISRCPFNLALTHRICFGLVGCQFPSVPIERDTCHTQNHCHNYHWL